MSSWEERLRQASQEPHNVARSEQDEQEAQRIRDEQWRQEMETIQRQRDALERSLPQVLEKFQAKQLLQDIRTRVWKVQADILYYPGSDIDMMQEVGQCGYSLRYGFPKIVDESVLISEGGPESSGPLWKNTGRKVKFTRHTYLTIGTGLLFESVPNSAGIRVSPVLQVKDSEVELFTTEGANRFPDLGAYHEFPQKGRGSTTFYPSSVIRVEDPQAQEKLEEWLLRSCLLRARQHTLPSELQSRG